MNSTIIDISFSLLRLGLGLGVQKAEDNLLVGFRHLKTDISNQEWEDIYNLGVHQGIAAIQFHGMQQLVDAQIDLNFHLPERKLKPESVIRGLRCVVLDLRSWH